MRNIWTICRKELNAYFASPIAYLVLAMFAIIFGRIFTGSVGQFALISMQSQMRGMPVDLNEFVIGPLLMTISFLGLFLVPLISMRLFAEEKRAGTIELLLTSPVRDHEIVIGKWLGAMLLYCLLLVVSALSFGFLFAHGQPDWKPVLGGYLGLLLQTGALLALGTFVSTLTKNQIIAGASAFGVCLLLWVFYWAGAEEQTASASVMRYISVFSHIEPFAKGLIDTKDVVYFVTMIFLGLFLSVRSIESLRWRA